MKWIVGRYTGATAEKKKKLVGARSKATKKYTSVQKNATKMGKEYKILK